VIGLGPIWLLAHHFGHVLGHALSSKNGADAPVAAGLPDEDDVAGTDLVAVTRDGSGDLRIRVGQSVGKAVLIRVALEDPERHSQYLPSAA
jgi:hypothetical protein